MSWGLLEGMGKGMQQAGTNMYEQAKLERINEYKKQQVADEREYQGGLLEQSNAREDQIRANERTWKEGQAEKDRASSERIAGMRANNARPVKQWEPITQKDMDGNVTVIGKFNTVTGERDMFNNPQPPPKAVDPSEIDNSIIKVPGNRKPKTLNELEIGAELKRTTVGTENGQTQYATGTPSQGTLPAMESVSAVISALSKNEAIDPEVVKASLPYLPPSLKPLAEKLLQPAGLLEH